MQAAPFHHDHKTRLLLRSRGLREAEAPPRTVRGVCARESCRVPIGATARCADMAARSGLPPPSPPKGGSRAPFRRRQSRTRGATLRDAFVELVYTHIGPRLLVHGEYGLFLSVTPEVWLSPLDTPSTRMSTRHSRVYARARRAPALSPLRSRASRGARAAAGGARAAGAGGSPPSRHSSGRGAEVDPGPRSLLSHSVLYLSPKNFRTHATQGGATNYNTHTRTTLLYGTVTIHS